MFAWHVLITGFIVLMLGGLIYTPPNFYQETDIDVGMQIVKNYRSQFAHTQIAGVICAAGNAVVTCS